MLTKQEFIDWAKSSGWNLDKFGHLRKDDYRLKLSSVGVRHERQITMSDGKHEWIRICYGYFKDLTIKESGVCAGFRR